MKKFIGLLAALLIAPAAFADNLKIGVIDADKIMQSSAQISSINKELEKKFRSRHDKIVEQQKNLQANIDKLNRDATVLSANDRKALEEKIIKGKNALRTDTESFQTDLNTAQNKAMSGFMQTFSAVIDSYARGEKYDIILLKQATAFSSSAVDVTAPIGKMLASKS